MLAGVLAEDSSEQRAAGSKEHFMGAHSSLGTDERDVDQRLCVEQCLERAEQMGLVVVPAQAVVLLAADGGRLVVHGSGRCQRVCLGDCLSSGRLRGLAPPSARFAPRTPTLSSLKSPSRRTAIFSLHSFRVHKFITFVH